MRAAIEVVDENGVPFVQLLRASNSRLRIDGLFRTEDRVLFLGRGDTNLKILTGADAKSYVPPPDFLPKLFRYPGREHARELIEPEPPRPPCARLSEGISAMSAGIVIPLQDCRAIGALAASQRLAFKEVDVCACLRRKGER